MRANGREQMARPLTILPEKGELFREMCPPVSADLEEEVRTLEDLAKWAGDFWRAPDTPIASADVPDELFVLAGSSGWVDGPQGAVLAYARALATRVEDRILWSLMEAAKKTAPRKGAPPSRRIKHGWYPGIGEDRRRGKTLGTALAAALAHNWQRAGQYGERAGIPRPTSAGGALQRDEWFEQCTAGLKEARALLQGHRRREQALRGAEQWERLGQAALKGEAATMARVMEGRRTGPELLTTLVDKAGVESRGAVEVVHAMTEHFTNAFAGDPNRPEALKTLGEDSVLGRQMRELAAAGAPPEAWREELGDEQFERLRDMVRRKVVRGAELKPGWHGDWLAPITEEEWAGHWASRNRRSAAGASGAGVDLWKEAPYDYHSRVRRLYSACMRLMVQPLGWRREIVVPIQKVAKSTALENLRPLKLLEVTKKAVMAIIKRRMSVDVERQGVLSQAQCGFRAGFNCHLAGLKLMAQLEAARRNREEVQVVALDIAKAYDSVERGWGKAVSLKRLAVADDVIEWLMEADRHNINSVKTGWEAYLREQNKLPTTFSAVTGFTQGAAESPLLWNLFYDMVLEQLAREGVGAEVTTGAAVGSGENLGLGGFADDTIIAMRQRGRCSEALTTTKSTLDLAGLRLAPAKSIHIGLRWCPAENTKEQPIQLELAEDDEEGVWVGNTRVPEVDFDIGMRYLGFWVDAAGDYGEETARLEQIIKAFGIATARRRVPAGVTLYLYKAILTARVLYPLVLACLSTAQIDALEDKAWAVVAPKLGAWRTMDKRLRHMATSVGGLGMVRWSTQVLERRTALLHQMSVHSAAWVRDIYDDLVIGWVRDRGGSGRAVLGAAISRKQRWYEAATEAKSWLISTDDLVRKHQMTWELTCRQQGWRRGDQELGSVGGVTSRWQAGLLNRADLTWVSDLCGQDGQPLALAQVPGWEWARGLLRRLQTHLDNAPLGEWQGALPGCPAWRPGSWVLVKGALGKLRSWRVQEGTWHGVVELAPVIACKQWQAWHIWSGPMPYAGVWPIGRGEYLTAPSEDIERCWGVRAWPDRTSAQFTFYATVGSEAGRQAAAPRPPMIGQAYDGSWTSGSPQHLKEELTGAMSRGLPIFAVSDGGLTLKATQPAGVILGVSTGGWALGVGLKVDTDGRDVGAVRWLAAGGQKLPSGTDVRQSSLRAEMGGAVQVARVLRGCLEGVQTVGRVKFIHASDNQGVVTTWPATHMASLAHLKHTAVPARLELAAAREVLTPLLDWRMTWVKAHPERDTKRRKEQWTDLERGNVIADEEATRAGHATATMSWDEQAMCGLWGGTWRGAGGQALELPEPSTQRQGLDGQLAMAYAKQRQSFAPNLSDPTVPWDTRVWQGGKNKDWGLVTFRTRLWWGHLVPHPARKELRCANCKCVAAHMQWHILAKCRHEKILACRVEATGQIQSQLAAVLKDLRLGPGVSAEIKKELRLAEGVWGRADPVAPEGSLGVNPWYGTFPSRWVTDWWVRSQSTEISAWHTGIKVWKRLAEAAVAACKSVWAVAASIHFERKRQAKWAARNAAAAAERPAPSAAEVAACLRLEVRRYKFVLTLRNPPGWSAWSVSQILAWGRSSVADVRRRAYQADRARRLHQRTTRRIRQRKGVSVRAEGDREAALSDQRDQQTKQSSGLEPAGGRQRLMTEFFARQGEG
jgi:hypothetical protein